MSISICGYDKECPECKNSSMFSRIFYKRKWIFLSEYSYTEYRCEVCSYFEGIPLDIKRNDILESIGI